MSIRRQIKAYVFNIFENFTQIYTNIKEDIYDKNLKAEKESQVTLLKQKRSKAPIPKPNPTTPLPLFTTINHNKQPKYDKQLDNPLKKYTPFMFDVKLEKSLGPLTRSKKYKDNKFIKPAFLKNKTKSKKSRTNNQHILYYDHNVVTISKKVLKYYADYDRIIIDKKILEENK